MIRPIYIIALKLWGPVSQILQAIEEFAELIVECNHYRRSNQYINLIEEIVDAEIMIEQLKALICERHQVTASCFEEIKDRKLVRLQGLIDEEEDRLRSNGGHNDH